MNKFDSEYSALKALAISVGASVPEGGWDSSYSIISSLYGHLVGDEPTDLSPIEMLTVLQEGTENGDIVWESSDCSIEIERLNNIIASLQEQLENCGSGGGSDCTEEIAELNTTIAELELQLQEASENADVALFGSIGYTKENANDFYTQLQVDLAYVDVIKQLFEEEKNSALSASFDCPNDVVFFPVIDASNMSRISFQGCTRLSYIPAFDSSQLVSGYMMFQNCSSLYELTVGDFSGMSGSLNNMFEGCTNLTKLPEYLIFGNSPLMSNFFKNCKSIKHITHLTMDCPDVNNMFNGCSSLISIPELNFANVTNINAFFGYSNITTLTDLGGFTGLKIDWKGSGSLKVLPNLTAESLVNVFNTIADVNDLGGKALEIGTTNLNKLTDEQKAIATSKGWTLS